MTSQNLSLSVEKRDILGKQVKHLRRQGIVPANIYGPNVQSLAVQVTRDALMPVLRAAGRHALISVQVAGEPAPRRALVRDVQRNAVTDEILHLDLYQASLTTTMTVDVPIVISGQAPAVELQRAILLQNLDHVTVECLPTDIPASIEADVSVLQAIGDALHVRDLRVQSGVRILNDPDLPVATAAPPTVVPEEVVPEEVAAAEEAAETAAEAEEATEAEGEPESE